MLADRDQYGYRIRKVVHLAGETHHVYDKDEVWIGTFPDSFSAELYTYYRGKEKHGK